MWSVWLKLRVFDAFGHVSVPSWETRFVEYHEYAAGFSGFPLRSRNFGVF